jgi:isoamylase
VLPDAEGNRVLGNSLLVLLNAHHEDMEFTLPQIDWGEEWESIVDTGAERDPMRRKTPARGKVTLKGRAMMVLRRPAPEEI